MDRRTANRRDLFDGLVLNEFPYTMFLCMEPGCHVFLPTAGYGRRIKRVDGAGTSYDAIVLLDSPSCSVNGCTQSFMTVQEKQDGSGYEYRCPVEGCNTALPWPVNSDWRTLLPAAPAPKAE